MTDDHDPRTLSEPGARIDPSIAPTAAGRRVLAGLEAEILRRRPPPEPDPPPPPPLHPGEPALDAQLRGLAAALVSEGLEAAARGLRQARRLGDPSRRAQSELSSLKLTLLAMEVARRLDEKPKRSEHRVVLDRLGAREPR